MLDDDGNKTTNLNSSKRNLITQKQDEELMCNVQTSPSGGAYFIQDHDNHDQNMSKIEKDNSDLD